MTRTSRNNGLSKPFIVLGVLVGAFFVAYAALFLAAITVHQEDRTTQSYADVQHLRVKGGEGDITVIAERRSDVQVVARREWSLAQPEVKQSFHDGELTLSGSCGFVGTIGPTGCSTDFELRVPLELTLDVRGSSGDVTARGLAADAYLCTSSGDLTAVDVTGPLRVAVSSGDVTVEGYGGDDVSAHASSGDVVLRTRTAPERIEAVASSGDVTVAVPGGIAYDVSSDTSSGDQSIDVDQSRDSDHRIDARASSGDVRVVRLGDAR